MYSSDSVNLTIQAKTKKKKDILTEIPAVKTRPAFLQTRSQSGQAPQALSQLALVICPLPYHGLRDRWEKSSTMVHLDEAIYHDFRIANRLDHICDWSRLYKDPSEAVEKDIFHLIFVSCGMLIGTITTCMQECPL